MPKMSGNDNRNSRPAFTVQDEIRRNRRIRRAERLRKARSRANVFFTVLLCLAICFLLIAAVVITVTRVQTVVVAGNERYSDSEILSAANLEGEILIFLSEGTVYKRISEVCPYVDAVVLEKEYPSKVTVRVVETEAKYVLSTRDRTLTLDSGLRVMDFTEETEGLVLLKLPEIKRAVEGKKIEFADDKAMGIVENLLGQFIGNGTAPWLSEIDISNRLAISGKAGDKGEIIFGDYKNIPEKIAMVTKLLADAEKEYAEYAYIDVSVLSQASLKLEY